MDKIELDADVAAWVVSILFPSPETGKQGAVINGIPGTPDFDEAVDLFTRAREQLTGR